MIDVMTALRSLPAEVQRGAEQAALDATPKSVISFEAVTGKVSTTQWGYWVARVVLIGAGGYGFGWAQTINSWDPGSREAVLAFAASLLVSGAGLGASALRRVWDAWTKYQIAKATAAATAYATNQAGRQIEVPMQPTEPKVTV